MRTGRCYLLFCLMCSVIVPWSVLLCYVQCCAGAVPCCVLTLALSGLSCAARSSHFELGATEGMLAWLPMPRLLHSLAPPPHPHPRPQTPTLPCLQEAFAWNPGRWQYYRSRSRPTRFKISSYGKGCYDLSLLSPQSLHAVGWKQGTTGTVMGRQACAPGALVWPIHGDFILGVCFVPPPPPPLSPLLDLYPHADPDLQY